MHFSAYHTPVHTYLVPKYLRKAGATAKVSALQFCRPNALYLFVKVIMNRTIDLASLVVLILCA